MPEYQLYHPHPTLTIEVTPEERVRALEWLQQARREGRLDDADLLRRHAMVDRARDRGELNAAFFGLVQVAPGSVEPRPVHLPGAGQALPRGRGVAVMAHLSAFLLWLGGPALFHFLAPRGSHVRREAAKAFNFQLVAFLVMVVCGVVVDDILGLGWVMALGALGWFVLTIVGAVKAGKGEAWRNPVTRVLPLKALDEG